MKPAPQMFLLAALLLPACFAEDPPEYAASAGAANLVEISPGVEVVADYDRPIFFADDLYWWFAGGIWYESAWYGGGWRRASIVSPRLAGIEHPEHFAHFHPQARIAVHGGIGFHSRSAPRGGHRR